MTSPPKLKQQWEIRYTELRGGYRVFQKGGLRPAIRLAGGGGGGGGCCPLQARYEKQGDGGGGGGGAVHLRPDTKSGGGGGPALQARYKKRGRGRGCLAEEGALPYMKGGVATPKPPPLDPPLGALTPSFTTTGPVERAAAQLVIMDAFKEYFSYTLHTLCGIPEITLEGTMSDWIALKEKAIALRDFDLSWWTDELNPILDQFVEAASGRVLVIHL